MLALTRTPDDALHRALHGRLPDVRRIGDALAPRRTAEVIYEGAIVAGDL